MVGDVLITGPQVIKVLLLLHSPPKGQRSEEEPSWTDKSTTLWVLPCHQLQPWAPHAANRRPLPSGRTGYDFGSKRNTEGASQDAPGGLICFHC